jgi:CRP-like cAMP-binding protein
MLIERAASYWGGRGGFGECHSSRTFAAPVIHRFDSGRFRHPMDRRTFNAGDTIFNVDDPSDRAYLIVVGTVEAQLPNGKQKRLGPGEIFGEMGLIDGSPRSATIVALDYTVCATYTETELLQAIRTQPEEAIAFIRALIARLREANRS